MPDSAAMERPSLLILWTTLLVAAILLVLGILFAVGVFRPWLRVLLSGGRVSPHEILAMRLRGLPPTLLIDAYLALHRSDPATPFDLIERVYLANRTRILLPDDLVSLVLRERETRH